MSNEISTAPKKEQVKKEPLFSPKNKKLLYDPMNDSNPITVQVLGICSALAVTVKMQPSIVMALAVMVVTAFSSLIISIIRNIIPNRIRIIVQLTVVAAMVILVDQFLKAFVYDVSKQLSVFVGLIITNCIVMGRLEAFAMANKPWPSFIDGIGNGLGYGVILVIVSMIRELLGSGELMGFRIIPESVYEMGYFNNGLIIMPPMALIIVGIIIWVQRSRNRKLIEAK
ncbi:MAG: NADH:ubiquinone reductase (Na(+)-transporting) subunit D [Sphingobacteriales bacterium 17-39-43]|uniref:NADH:ubiquinone reductase (Na(+)-transporting) subunit D n=1 Tax=Daejeonella sp. TaxID=2805397 RepID=UPI000BCDF355|nr:NADH:ubiquinone reductase (Na(+)-transporting) subunit D [Daejeonella sp.]OYX92158.1 MAG: NADH:ubiquinone reductase (Na(+)-transporting) subunit D [Sphingobacteriia bacterium 35-40-5]OYZ28879.1 MAG: NADH:ubiquinone reductase (Na(+)-transporting) subunit D [Sphingobacteriales bacterium 16-39-50]OZA22261.1 MAG: NADH:ubiquinone reductase (Na(+)-transporting) subunit D [Sphingobacteriales bacterium 17-39-43]HQT22486.1 NADH:ubiquinone reductase (Na(+)-transporting) subunit D [Daejeonella sp.]HQT